MATMEKPTLRQAIRHAARDLSEAPDRHLLEVVAMVDAMPVRGEADLILEPLRPRLARLRPPRPLRFARLLFLPLDPLIVPAPRWRPGDNTVPRTAIPAIAEAVEAEIGPVSAEIGASIEGRTTEDREAIDTAGALLWPAAATLLKAQARPPAGWDATGIARFHYRPLASRIGGLLSQATRLWRLEAAAAQGLVTWEFKALRALLSDVAAFDPEALPMAVAALLARIPEAAPILSDVAQSMGGGADAILRQASEAAALLLLEQMEAPGGAEARLGGRDLADAGATVRRLGSLLDILDSGHSPRGRRERLNGLRQRIHEGCLSLFAGQLSSDFLEPLRAANGGDAWDLEAATRGLRTLETEARRMGGGSEYDGLLKNAAQSVRDAGARGALGQASQLRLMELLAGPDAALALLDEDAAGMGGLAVAGG